MKFWIKDIRMNGVYYDVRLEVKKNGLKIVDLYMYEEYDGNNKIAKEINELYGRNIFFKKVEVNDEIVEKDILSLVNRYMSDNILMNYSECVYDDDEW